MRCQVRNNLVGRNSMLNGAADRFASNAARYHVRIAGRELSEESENSNLERGRGIGVETVVGFDDYESSCAA